MFRTILLPVDFEINTEMAVKKALELSDSGQTVIHLFHVQKPAMPWNSIWGNEIFQADGENQVPSKLIQWKRLIEENYPDVKVVADLVYSMKIERSIIEKAKEIKADRNVRARAGSGRRHTVRSRQGQNARQPRRQAAVPSSVGQVVEWADLGVLADWAGVHVRSGGQMIGLTLLRQNLKS